MTLRRQLTQSSPLTRSLTGGASLLALLLVAACSKSESTVDNTKEAKKVAQTQSPAQGTKGVKSQAEGKVERRAHADYNWTELKEGKAQAGLAPIQELNAWGKSLYEHPSELLQGESAPKPAAKEEAEPLDTKEIATPQLEFTRVAGGQDGFCGAMKSGPLKCWGRTEKRNIGAYIDAATSGTSACGVDVKGRVKCMPENAGAEALSDVKRIWAGGSRYCALGKSKSVTCFSATSGEVIEDAVAEGLEALYLGVGKDFVCAANTSRELTCSGNVAPLKLPKSPLKIKDLAAGALFVCALDESSKLNCFGSAPTGLTGEFKGLAAGFNTLCGIDSDGKGSCVGDVTYKWQEEVKRFAVSDGGVCATLRTGTLLCIDNEGKEIDVPLDTSALLKAEHEAKTKENQAKYAANQAARAKAKRLSAGEKKLRDLRFSAFSKLFPTGALPASFSHTDKIRLGDRLPSSLNSIVEGDANSFLIGEKFTLASGAVVFSAYDLIKNRAVLWSFDNKGRKSEFFLNSHSSSSSEGGSDEDGREYSRQAESLETVLSQDTLVTTTHEGREDVFHVPTHKDGSKPISRVSCRVDQLKFQDAFSKEGKVTREALPSPGDISTSTRDKGCELWPFDGPRSSN